MLEGALRSADVVIATPMRHTVVIGTDLVGVMKRKVIVVDATIVHGQVFPSLPVVDLGRGCNPSDGDGRKCLCNVSGRVPRTAAMAVSNALVTLFDDIIAGAGTGSAAGLIRMLPGVQPAVFSFMGKIVNAQMASSIGTRCADLSLYLSLS